MKYAIGYVLAASVYAVVASQVIGCGGFYATLGTKEAIRAHYDGQNGFITNGKASPDKDTAHWISRKLETNKDAESGFIASLFKSEAK